MFATVWILSGILGFFLLRFSVISFDIIDSSYSFRKFYNSYIWYEKVHLTYGILALGVICGFFCGLVMFVVGVIFSIGIGCWLLLKYNKFCRTPIFKKDKL